MQLATPFQLRETPCTANTQTGSVVMLWGALLHTLFYVLMEGLQATNSDMFKRGSLSFGHKYKAFVT